MLGAAGKAILSPKGTNSKTGLPVERNPFVIPSDQDVWAMREQERVRKEEARRSNLTTKIWDKTELQSTMTRTRKLIQQMAPDVDAVALKKARESRGLVTAATAAIARDRQRDHESLTDFMAKKREMFLVQMSLDVKRDEIAKLERKAADKEESLRKAELALEEDAIRFDAFLKENDQQAHDAVKRAEAQAKLKADKVSELKRLKHAIGLITAEKAKLREVVDDYRRYKAFLDALTPSDYTEDMLRKREEAVEGRRKATWQRKVDFWEAMRAAKETEITAKVEQDRKLALRQGRAPPKVDIAAVVASQLPHCPSLDVEHRPAYLPEEEDLPLYFREPGQLLEIFTQLEESNLFLIQNCQDTEEQLEELRQLHAEAAAEMQRQSASLDEGMASLQAQLTAEEMKAAVLKKKIAMADAAKAASAGGKVDSAALAAAAAAGGSLDGTSGAGGDAAAKVEAAPPTLEALLPALREAIIEVYEQCGYKATAGSDTIAMLTQLEGRLETLLSQLSGLDPEYVALKEKEREKERRVRVREARMHAQQEIHEQRLSKMLERAQAPVIKRTGKPVMWRSQPFAKKVVVQPPDPREEQEKADAVYFN